VCRESERVASTLSSVATGTFRIIR
jgi:hypothetical protein